MGRRVEGLNGLGILSDQNLSITLERPYELAPGQRYCSCQFYVPARVKNMAVSTRLHKVSTKL